MFTPLGLFRNIPCPQGQNCDLLTCIFSHNAAVSSHLVDQTSSQDAHAVSEDTSIATPIQRHSKRIKLETVPDSSSAEGSNKSSLQPSKKKYDIHHQKDVTGTSKTSNNGGFASAVDKKTDQQSSGNTVKLHSTSRDVSPPPTREEAKATRPRKTELGNNLLRRNAPRESLNPRMLAKAPASHAVRTSILTKLHAAMSSLNEKVVGENNNNNKCTEKYLILTPNELVTMALDEEEKVAKANSNIYTNVIKLRIVKFSKMSKEDWLEEVKAHLNSRYYRDRPIGKQQQGDGLEDGEKKQKTKEQKPLSTGLSAAEELAIVRKLVTPLDGLEQFGYVTKAPNKEEIEIARKGAAESRGWEKCERCGGRFQVFPGRREDGALTGGGQCTFHPAKAAYPPRKPTDHLTGSGDPFFPCCNEAVGTSVGCTKNQTHVFKVTETKRLASILQFEETPAHSTEKGEIQQQQHSPPICVDCEMGYTTQGMELIRLTAVSWPEGKEMLDVLVKPMGEILDLNSQWSGVFPEHFANSVPYGSITTTAAAAAATTANSTTRSATVSENGEIETTEPPQTLQVVDSPAAARELLFQHLQPDTPLIGHAIDNDLNACRIVHPTIIDTVLLYPHPKGGLPMRTSLKVLSRKFLEREIQMGGGGRGHDSKEDAIATGDLVRVKAAETWKILKAKGWVIQDGNLVSPERSRGNDDNNNSAFLERSLGPGAGKKRKEL